MNNLVPSVCIDAVLGELPVDQALKQVADCGFRAFEFWAWWEKDIDHLNELRAAYDLTVSACCTKFITLADPTRREEYEHGVADSIEAATRLGCKTLISQVGDTIEGVTRDEMHQSLVDGLKQVAPLLESSGITLVIEPLNEKVDHPGYFLTRSDEAFEIVRKVASDHVKVVFDIYHQQITEGDLLTNILANIDQIGHFHAAGNPGRHELTRGEIHYPEIFKAIAATTYNGFVGLEYWPRDQPASGLQEVASWF